MSAICRLCHEPIGEQSWLVHVQQNARADDAYHERCWQAANGLVAAPSADVRNAIGHCWRMAQGYAEKAENDEKYAYMCAQVDIVKAWWEAMGGWAHEEASE